jgi:hypothetical protein
MNLGISRFLSCFTSLNALAREPTSFAMRSSSSSKTSQSRLANFSGRMNSLYFGASFAPRIEHAASQIHDSRDLLLLPPVAMNIARILRELAALGQGRGREYRARGRKRERREEDEKELGKRKTELEEEQV